MRQSILSRKDAAKIIVARSGCMDVVSMRPRCGFSHNCNLTIFLVQLHNVEKKQFWNKIWRPESNCGHSYDHPYKCCQKVMCEWFINHFYNHHCCGQLCQCWVCVDFVWGDGGIHTRGSRRAVCVVEAAIQKSTEVDEALLLSPLGNVDSCWQVKDYWIAQIVLCIVCNLAGHTLPSLLNLFWTCNTWNHWEVVHILPGTRQGRHCSKTTHCKRLMWLISWQSCTLKSMRRPHTNFFPPLHLYSCWRVAHL